MFIFGLPFLLIVGLGAGVVYYLLQDSSRIVSDKSDEKDWLLVLDIYSENYYQYFPPQWSPDGHQLLVRTLDDSTDSDDDYVYRIYDVATGAVLWEIDWNIYNNAQWSPQGNYISSTLLDVENQSYQLVVFDLETHTNTVLHGNPNDINHILESNHTTMIPARYIKTIWHPDETMITTLTELGILRIWSLDGDIIFEYDSNIPANHALSDPTLKWHPNGRYLALYKCCGNIAIIDIENLRANPMEIENPTGFGIAWHPTESVIALAQIITEDDERRQGAVPNVVTLFNVENQTRVVIVSEEQNFYRYLEWNNAGTHLVIASFNHTPRMVLPYTIWEYETGISTELASPIDFLDGGARWVANDDILFATASGSFYVWNGQTFQMHFGVFPAGYNRTVISLDGKFLATTQPVIRDEQGEKVEDPEIVVDIQAIPSGEIVTTLTEPENYVNRMEFSADSNYFYTIDDDYRLRVWKRSDPR